MESVAMAPEGPTMDDFKPREPSPTTINKEHSTPKKPNIRKRTKTGCLTCRKRRIKCDEGKPTCNNCLKSKRNCEGYNQRVVFKSPMGTLPGGPFGPIPYHHHPDPTEALVNAQLSAAQGKAASSSQGPLPMIAPKPPSQYGYGSAAAYAYLGMYPGIHRAHSAASLGLGIQQPQYIMDAVSPESFYSQPPIEMTASPTQMSQPTLFDFQIPPPQQSGMGFAALPERRHTTYAKIERPVVSPTVSFTPPRRQTQYTRPEPSKKAEPSWETDEDRVCYESEEEQVSVTAMADLDAQNLGPLVATNLRAPLDLCGTQVRSFRALADERVLVNYVPSPTDTPLNDPKTAAVFWYFVTVTAPSLNPYERNRIDPSRIFSNEPIPKSDQHIWSYVFPVQSFQHPALLQAILALGSLQMAGLSGDSPTASWLHYGLCVRRNAKNYGSPRRRASPATLAATLLLAFYEVWISNHEKWCTHLFGARHIIGETPFRQMSRQVWTIHRQRHQQWLELQADNPFAEFMPRTGHPNHELAEVDLGLVRNLTGRPIDFLEGIDSSSWQGKARTCTDRDLENYEHMADLYWWFCKMDVYQSTLGGSKLFMDYNLWTQCPPRAPINRINQIYGTSDHLFLLLGRLSNFVADDLPRKHKAQKSGLNSSPKGPNSPPMFAGMFPGRGNIRPPRGLSPPRDGFADAEKILDDMDLETSTHKALEEWHAIRGAFDLFKRSLGPDFTPLDEDVHPPLDSPFGAAHAYRTHIIAGVWMNFWMGMVILHRAHPSMPPFAMVAAHMCAGQTEPFAKEIGKIVAGIAEDWSGETMVSRMVGAMYIECCFPLFVGAVQLRDKFQRQWAIRRLHDITRLTGWKTGNQIANGCEGAWRKAAAMGVAPPYEPESECDALRHGYTTRRIDERIQEVDEGQNKPVLQRSDRAHVAFGLLSIDEDFQKLSVED